MRRAAVDGIFGRMSRSNILVVVVDGLRASALGAYGNTTYQTSALDGFASESLLIDWCFAPSHELDDIYRAMWHSRHPLRSVTASSSNPELGHASLPAMLAEFGYELTLITDDAAIPSSIHRKHFNEVICLDPQNAEGSVVTPCARAARIADTQLARIFEGACERVSHSTLLADSPPQMVWVHSRGLYGPWDAPLDLQASLFDEDDPPPVEAVAPPDFDSGIAGDPDAVFRYGCAYSAQVMVLDACWRGLLDTVASARRSAPWIVLLLGLRGFPLGEHGRIGGCDSRLFAEQLHVPWLIQVPSDQHRLARCTTLATHLDLLPTLLGLIGSTPREGQVCDGVNLVPVLMESAHVEREFVVAANNTGVRSLHTAEWSLREATPARSEFGQLPVPGASYELYVRPDDRWEMNDVAKLCPDIVDVLRRTLACEADQLARDGLASSTLALENL